MKKLKIVLFSVLAMGALLTSCGSDDSNESVNEKIEGKWILTKTATGEEALKDYEHTIGCSKDFIEIIGDGVFRDVDYQGSECTEEVDTGKWVKGDNILTVTYTYGEGETQGEEVLSFTILSLTGSELKLKTVYEEGGVDVTAISLFTRAN